MSKTPAKTADKKHESRHNQWWYPSRCELPGCDSCGMVQYCSREHQKEDWPQHKEECKVFKSLGLRATFYKDEDMLARFPLAPPKRFDQSQRHRHRGTEPIPKGSKCLLCLKGDDEVAMTCTCCCGRVICDTSANYVLMSYSREFCDRSHERYTLCGYHGVEPECDRSKDWRECPEHALRTRTTASHPTTTRTATPADITEHDIADTLWRGLNPYNYCPLLTADVPRHALCETCGVRNKKYVSGLQGCSIGKQPNGRFGYSCLGCSRSVRGGALIAGVGGSHEGYGPLKIGIVEV